MSEGLPLRQVIEKVKISVITVCYNSVSTIDDTLRSVAAQSDVNVEHIIVDGGSNDGTLDVINAYQASIAKVLSEPDHGIYDAMNKGIALASGEVIGFLNADDFYINERVLNRVADIFSDPEVDACFGDLLYVEQRDTQAVVRYWKSCHYQKGLFEKGWAPPHPTFFVRRSVFQRFGGFDLSFRIAADLELMVRYLAVHKIRSRYLPEILVKMRMGGTTNRSLSNILRQNQEIMTALQGHGLRASWIWLLGHKFVSRAWQFFIRPKH